MSRIDELPADRRAVLQLILKQGKSYDELATLLRIEPDKVRERARDALDQLGPGAGSGLALERQDELSDYLLGQQDPGAAARSRELLEESPAARAWARVVAGELRSLGGDGLPEIPPDRAERPAEPAPPPPHAPQVRERREGRAPSERRDLPAEPATGARQRSRPSSRTGGLLLLIAVGAAIAVFIIFVVGGGSDDNGKTTASTTSSTPSTSTQPRVLGQINLNPPQGTTSRALAALTLVQQGQETDILFQGQGIPPNQTGDVYALWVAGNGRVARLGFMPRVGKSGKVRFPGALPNTVDLSKYKTLLMTRETSASPTRPGPVILQGKLPAGG